MVARQTSGMTGADLANICNEAAIFAGREHRDHLLTRDFEAALERVVAGMQSRRVITDHEKKVVAYHEAGHALCSEMLPSVQKVHRISIIPRGRALGYTLNLPEEDRYLKSREELLDYMVVLLAGRVSEHIIFGQITTGASDDLHKVHEISRSMVTQYGMGTELASKQLPSDDYSMSDHTRRMVDEEQQYLTDLAHRRAMEIVGEQPRRCSRRWPTPCSRTRSSSARTSSAWWPSTAQRRRRRRSGASRRSSPSPARPRWPRPSASRVSRAPTRRRSSPPRPAPERHSQSRRRPGAARRRRSCRSRAEATTSGSPVGLNARKRTVLVGAVHELVSALLSAWERDAPRPARARASRSGVRRLGAPLQHHERAPPR